MKAPDTKLQTPEKLQISSSKAPTSLRELEIGASDFSGVWCFVPGRPDAGHEIVEMLKQHDTN